MEIGIVQPKTLSYKYLERNIVLQASMYWNVYQKTIVKIKVYLSSSHHSYN